MSNLLTLLPFLISFLTGYFLIYIIFHKKKAPPLFLSILLGGGLGLGVCAYMTFLSFFIYNHLNLPFVIILNLFLLLGSICTTLGLKQKTGQAIFQTQSISVQDGISLFILFILLIPIWLQATYYQYGGWDAWSVWNFKAKMLFLGGDNWTNMFDPMLWRSSPHYPLLLPLINVWGWLFPGQAVNVTPILTAFMFTILTLGLLLFGLKQWTGNIFSFLAVGGIATSTLFIQLATSQYSDIVVGFYLLACLFCLIESKTNNSPAYSLLAGLMAGFLTFSKSEGQMAAMIISLLFIPYFLYQNRSTQTKKQILFFILGAALTFWPTVIFYLQYSSPNITFINGITSTIKPITLDRFKIILGFSFFELISWKWHGLWIAVFLGLIFSIKKCFNPKTIIIPAFLFIYASITGAYYLINTYFEITWWLQVTLSRLLFAILPTVLLWVFYSVVGDK